MITCICALVGVAEVVLTKASRLCFDLCQYCTSRSRGGGEGGGELSTGAADCNYVTGLNNPAGIALDPSSGALYVTNLGSVCRVPPGGGAFAFVCTTGIGVPTICSFYDAPSSFTFDCNFVTAFMCLHVRNYVCLKEGGVERAMANRCRQLRLRHGHQLSDGYGL